MDPVSLLVGLVIGLVAAGFMFAQLAKVKADLSASQVRAGESDRLTEKVGDLEEKLDTQNDELQSKNLELKEIETKYKAEREAVEEQHRLLAKAKEDFKEAFTALAAEALKGNQEQFLKLADQSFSKHNESSKSDLEKRQQAIDEMLKPMKDNLDKIGEQNQQMERRRSSAYGELIKQVESLGTQQVGLQKETTRLVKALQDPGSAGSWGEMVLERVLEMAGLQEHITFEQQETIQPGDSKVRPDAIVKLPQGRVIVIDSKAPMKQYLEALETDDPLSQQTLLGDHAKKVEEHARALSKRNYSDLHESPDFTVLFIPSEAAFRSAVENRPGLIENAMDQHVILATPTTLLALMKAVEYGWQQEALAANMKHVQDDGKKLYDSLATLAGHYAKLGKSLKSTVSHYNGFVGSLEGSVLPAARRFAEHGISSKNEVEEAEQQDLEVREFAKPELSSPAAPDALPFED
jgi:DNA recombination protein RmuC